MLEFGAAYWYRSSWTPSFHLFTARYLPSRDTQGAPKRAGRGLNPAFWQISPAGLMLSLRPHDMKPGGNLRPGVEMRPTGQGP